MGGPSALVPGLPVAALRWLLAQVGEDVLRLRSLCQQAGHVHAVGDGLAEAGGDRRVAQEDRPDQPAVAEDEPHVPLAGVLFDHLVAAVLAARTGLCSSRSTPSTFRVFDRGMPPNSVAATCAFMPAMLPMYCAGLHVP